MKTSPNTLLQVYTDRKHVLIDINGLSFSNETFMSRRDVFHHLPTLHPLQLLWNVFKINLIPVRRISTESTKKPICEQLSEYEPTQDVSFMAYTIDKQVFSQKLFHSLYIHIKDVLRGHFNRVVLPVMTTCCSDSGLMRMQILINLTRL